jgi:hypothetical protein
MIELHLPWSQLMIGLLQMTILFCTSIILLFYFHCMSLRLHDVHFFFLVDVGLWKVVWMQKNWLIGDIS